MAERARLPEESRIHVGRRRLECFAHVRHERNHERRVARDRLVARRGRRRRSDVAGRDKVRLERPRDCSGDRDAREELAGIDEVSPRCDIVDAVYKD